jgi:hypothetical protein
MALGFVLVINSIPLLKAQDFHPTTHWPYLFDNFKEGEIYFSGDKKTEGKLNIHLWGNVLQYVNDEGKIYDASDKNVVRVEIAGEAFLFSDHKLMQIIGSDKTAVLLKLTSADFSSMTAGQGAYGANLNTAATTQLSSLDLGGLDKPSLGKMLQERSEGREIPLNISYYYLLNGQAIEANKKSVGEYLEERSKVEWNKFLKNNKIKWKKESSLIDVLHFLAK